MVRDNKGRRMWKRVALQGEWGEDKRTQRTECHRLLEKACFRTFRLRPGEEPCQYLEEEGARQRA